MWDLIAEDLLAAAVGSGVAVDRSYVAPGPQFARDCRSIVVYLDTTTVVDPVPRNARGTPLGMCAWVPQATFQVVFVADCVPGPDERGLPPSADAITAWSTVFLADQWEIFDALSAKVEEGVMGVACEGVRLGISPTPSLSPSGGVAQRQWPVTVTQSGDSSSS